jgi:methyl-accepting chemotaxis protein
MAKRFKRRNYFINKSFQSKFIIKFTLIVFLVSAVMALVLLFFAYNSNTVAIENTHVVVKNTADFILPVTVVAVVSAMLICAVFTAILTLVTSHKIAGPLYRIELDLKEVANGDFTRGFKIRGDDQLQILARDLQQMCVVLRDKHVRVSKSLKDLQNFLRENDYKVSDSEVENLKRLVDELSGSMGVFKI